jgi:rare lipoprotein A
MRLVLVAALAALASTAGLSPASAASASDRIREIGTSSRSVSWTDNDRPRFEHRRTARATTRDLDDDYDVRPRRRYQTESYDTPRYAQRRHKRTAKRARRHQHAATRRSARRTAERRSHRVRRAAVRPADRTSRGYSGASEASGVASYYWQPQRLATGGWFNPDGLTAAHRTLPFGTRVRVTHASSGRSVNVVINDRGPYIAGRIIDLSRGAAKIIGMTGRGIARVKVQVLGRSGS